MGPYLLEELELDDSCPCRRQLANNNGGYDFILWQLIYTSIVLLCMFAALLSDRLGTDSVMVVALTAFMAAGIISLKEGLAGFSNDGLLTVLTLFVVAEGISKTGALDWYMGKLLGRPKTAASAQVRLMLPIAVVSAFLNNTPVVVVMIPIVQKWARKCNLSAQQLLIPLSFATILGGTCTLIGTSTNLVVVGLLKEKYPNDPTMNIGLFDLGVYGVPVALAGIGYLLVASPWLLPGGSRRRHDDGEVPLESHEAVLLGARLAPWSPAAGRSVKRSGLRDTGGIFLVSVRRATTGNVHRAVGQDFVLQVGDILYFTGLIESFGEFCAEHGLELFTNEMEQEVSNFKSDVTFGTDLVPAEEAKTLLANDGEAEKVVPVEEIGVTRDSMMNADEMERSQAIARMEDLIRGFARDEPTKDEERIFIPLSSQQNDFEPMELAASGSHKVVVTSERDLVVVGVEAPDRSGLLLDISKGLSRLNLNIRHTEASVRGFQSISIWRCEMADTDLPDLEEIWSVVNSFLASETGVEAVKARGLRVLRAVIPKGSSLIGKQPSEVNFRQLYQAAIVAIQKGGSNVAISSIIFGPGDVLVLQVSENSPLLKIPPPDFYKNLAAAQEGNGPSRGNTVKTLVGRFSTVVRNMSSDNLQIMNQEQRLNEEQLDVENVNVYGREQDAGNSGNAEEVAEFHADEGNVWKDLQVVFLNQGKAAADGAGTREFLTAMQVRPKSQLAGRTVAGIGLDKLPGVFLVSIDRPAQPALTDDRRPAISVFASVTEGFEADGQSEHASKFTVDPRFEAISSETSLLAGDVLWFAGSALAVGDLRKVPGLISYESEEVEKINETVHDRRLVEAVIARRGPLAGKTVKEARFRTRFGAAVIAVHRDGKRIHDHPGNIKLQAGDVLLLEAGPTFIKKSVDNDRSFALVAEVKDSAPPRLWLLVPALFITVVMLAVFTAGVAPLLVCALVASVLMVCLGILSEQEVRDAIHWEVYIAISAAFGIGTAMVNSGVAGVLASLLVSMGESMGIGDAGLLGSVYLATFLISNIVTNNAAAALMFPIALEAAEKTGTNRLIMSYCLMLGASASFMTPFGYTTNLLIYGPGGYKAKDFIMIGTPMQIVLWLLSTLFLSTITSSNWWIYWVATILALVGIVSGRSLNPMQLFRGTKKDNE